MDDAQKKLSDALKAIKGAQAAIPSNFQDLAGDALSLFRRSLTACEPFVQEGILDLPKVDKLDVLDFLVKSAAKKHRKAQVVECLEKLLVKPAWGRIAASSDNRSSLEALLEGHTTLLQILTTPVTEEDEELQRSAAEKQGKTLSAEDQDLLGKALCDGREAMREVGWEYQTGINKDHLSDKAIAAFRSFYNGITKLDSSGASNAAKVIETLRSDFPNLLQFLTTLHEGRKSQRGQVAYVVQKLAEFSPDFAKLMEQQSTIPWTAKSQIASGYPTPVNPQSADNRKDIAPASSNPFSKFKTTLVLVRVGVCQPAHKGCQETQETVGSHSLVVHRFHDDPSQASSNIHVDVFAHIMDLVLNHSSTKEVVGVIIDNVSRLQGIFEDIRNFFVTRSLELPKLITLRGPGTDGIIVAANDEKAMDAVRSEIARRESLL